LNVVPTGPVAGQRAPIELIGLARVEAGTDGHDRLIDRREYRRADEIAGRRERTDDGLNLLLGRRRQYRRAGRDRIAELEARPVGLRRLLRVAVDGAEVRVEDLENMKTRAAGGRNAESCGSVGRYR
jgi:hypothetical protein